MVFPKLIDNNTSFHLQNTLHKCHETRVNLYYYVFNISVLVLFVIVTGIILYNCYNNKLTDYDRQQKILRDQEFITSKIRYYQENCKDMNERHSSNITNLPSIRV